MLIVALVFAGLAALLHVYIWVLESLVWSTKGRRVFGVSAEQAAANRQFAYNQGFYNLFLAIGTGVGVAFAAADCHWGLPLVVFGTACMAGAALVLVTDDRTQVRGAVVQGTFPALALVSLALHLATR
jgi:putative membrane protein